jgi:large subunit ribosomal protein L14e
MFEIGRVAVKIAGRDAGLQCVVVDILDDNFVLVDGQTRRRKCNIKHLEPLNNFLDLNKNAGHDEVVNAMKAAGLHVVEAKKSSKVKKSKSVKPAKKRNALLKQEQEKEALQKDKKGKK